MFLAICSKVIMCAKQDRLAGLREVRSEATLGRVQMPNAIRRACLASTTFFGRGPCCGQVGGTGAVRTLQNENTRLASPKYCTSSFGLPEREAVG